MPEIDMRSALTRFVPLIGEEGLTRLKNAKVAVYGLGGVGGSAAEALARAGVGKLYLIDADEVSLSNLNRQAVAATSTLGEKKAFAMAKRLQDIAPWTKSTPIPRYFSEEVLGEFPFEVDGIVDAIDSIGPKKALIKEAFLRHIPLVSSMGAGNKMHPELLEVLDISKTSVDPLARIIRAFCKKEGISPLTVVASKEEPVVSSLVDETGKRVPCSSPFVPPAAGLMLASALVEKILKA